jgi:HD-GYP domain-containing protein (c-di-GMP phosphodiesterase class II)
MELLMAELLGCQLNKDIFNHLGILLIVKNSILTSDHILLLNNHHIAIEATDVDHPESERLIASAAAEIEEIFSSIRSTQNIPVNEVQSRILPSISIVAETPDLFHLLAGLQAKDDYTYRHNVGVAVFSNMIGKWLHLSNSDLADLTLAATFHDVGKIYIADEILNKPGKFTDSEYEQMKRHTILGYEIIKKNPSLAERVALVAIQHHEREDGTGYPFGIKGEEMDFFSKIVAVADIFHALSTHRVYREALPFYKIIQIMREESFGRLNSSICRMFIQRMMELTVGGLVTLSSGQKGKVVLINPAFPERPLVAVDNQFIDLSKADNVHIESLSIHG